MSTDFSSVPVLDYALVASDRPAFVAQLRHALINVGFLYLSNPPVRKSDIDALVEYIPRVFALPQAAKDAIKMSNSEHFLGYSRLGAELTKGAVDQREQFDFATPYENHWVEGDPDYLRLWGASQWFEEDELPGFKRVMLTYLVQVETLANKLTGLVAEALGLSNDGLAEFFDASGLMQHRAKIVKYPTAADGVSRQGVGPHYDAGFLTFLLQASPHTGLQVQNLAGDWIDVPPIDGTFVVNFGKAIEAVTQGVARATSHRVVSPSDGQLGPRYSVPFFQNIAQHVRLSEHSLPIPQEVLDIKNARGELRSTDSVNFSEYDRLPSGQVTLIGRVKSHPDVAQIHYPHLFAQYFPDGLPAHGSAY